MTITKAKNEREVLVKIADDWYGVDFDELRPEEQDEIYFYAYDNDMIEMEVV